MPALKYRTTMPRPTDPEIIRAVCTSVEKGHPLETAGQLAGLGSSVAAEWRSKGEALIAQHPDQTPAEIGSYALFAYELRTAEAKMVDAKLSVIEAATQDPAKGWVPAMTLLERRRPQDFGRNQRIEVSSTVTYVHELGPQALSAIAQRMLETNHTAIDADTTPQLPPAPSDSAD